MQQHMPSLEELDPRIVPSTSPVLTIPHAADIVTTSTREQVTVVVTESHAVGVAQQTEPSHVQHETAVSASTEHASGQQEEERIERILQGNEAVEVGKIEVEGEVAERAEMEFAEREYEQQEPAEASSKREEVSEPSESAEHETEQEDAPEGLIANPFASPITHVTKGTTLHGYFDFRASHAADQLASAIHAPGKSTENLRTEDSDLDAVDAVFMHGGDVPTVAHLASEEGKEVSKGNLAPQQEDAHAPAAQTLHIDDVFAAGVVGTYAAYMPEHENGQSDRFARLPRMRW